MGAATTDRSGAEEDSNRLVSATITGTMHAIEQREQRAAQRTRYSLNGNRSVSGSSRRPTPPDLVSTGQAGSINDDVSRVTYDHLGNIRSV